VLSSSQSSHSSDSKNFSGASTSASTCADAKKFYFGHQYLQCLSIGRSDAQKPKSDFERHLVTTLRKA